MGLCRCSRRRVTSLFCFEHRVNVCEFCLVSDHKRCIVKSYMCWVKDSHFDSSCAICRRNFEDTPEIDCVRLLCLDVFHWECLDAWVSSLPPTTAPSGILCPTCENRVIPPANHGGPIAEALRTFLNTAKWIERIPDSGHSHLNGLMNFQQIAPLSCNPDESEKLLDPKLDLAARQFLNGEDLPTSSLESAAAPNSQNQVFHSPSPSYAGPQDSSSSMFTTSQRREQPSVHVNTGPLPTPSEDDDKYRRHVSFSGVTGLISYSFSRLLKPLPFRRRPYLLLLLVVILTFCFFMTLNPGSDLLLNPNMNPNIRVVRGVDQQHPPVFNA